MLCRKCLSLLRFSKQNDNFKRFYGILTSAKTNDWYSAISDAEKIVGYPTSYMSLRCLLSDEFSNVAMNIRKLVGSKHPLLKTARGLLYDSKHNMQTRGLMVLLISKAAGPGQGDDLMEQDPISGIYLRHVVYPQSLQIIVTIFGTDLKTICEKKGRHLKSLIEDISQRSLAEITEMIHTASLIHKGVVNMKEVVDSDNNGKKDMEFGNKMAVLSGDFLLANACTELASLNNTMVVETISGAITDLMEAEFTELRNSNGDPVLKDNIQYSDWLTQTYLSSGSLLAKSCKSALELANHGQKQQEAAFIFGENIGYLQQIKEDLKPFNENGNNIHVESFSLTSAPVVKYVEQNPEVANSLRGLQGKEVKKVILTIMESPALELCHHLMERYGEKAKEALNIFQDTDAKRTLIKMINAMIKL